MAITESIDLFQRENVGPAAVDIAFTSTPILNVAGLIHRIPGEAGSTGDIITFPYWNTDITGITQDAVRNSRTGVAASKVSLSSAPESAVTKVISIDLDSFAARDSALNVNKHIADIAGREFGREMQASLYAKIVAAATAAGLVVDRADSGGNLTVNAILEALLEWGDKSSELGTPVLFCSSQQFHDLGKSSDFRELAKAGLATGAEAGNAFVRAVVHGVPIVLMDAIDKTDGEHSAVLLAPGVAGVFASDEPETAEIRHPGSAVMTVDVHFRYASHCFKHNPVRGVVIKTLVDQPEPEPDPEP